jgi:hypothetical protein
MKHTLLVYNPENTRIIFGKRYFELPIDVLTGKRTDVSVVAQFPSNFIIIDVWNDASRTFTETTVEAYCQP